jgi:hypothetical protein
VSGVLQSFYRVQLPAGQARVGGLSPAALGAQLHHGLAVAREWGREGGGAAQLAMLREDVAALRHAAQTGLFAD